MHTDPDLLALLALGEAVGPEEERHVATCPGCTAELESLRRAVGVARSAADVTLAEPGPRVWAAIRDGLDAGARATGPEQRSYARLTPVLETWAQATGEAELATDGSGRRLLQVTLRAQPPSTGLWQAWLVHRDDPEQRQTLGVLDGPHGLWTVAHAIDVDLYPILEISQEDVGSTGHSGRTVVRGQLQPV